MSNDFDMLVVNFEGRASTNEIKIHKFNSFTGEKEEFNNIALNSHDLYLTYSLDMPYGSAGLEYLSGDITYIGNNKVRVMSRGFISNDYYRVEEKDWKYINESYKDVNLTTGVVTDVPSDFITKNKSLLKAAITAAHYFGYGLTFGHSFGLSYVGDNKVRLVTADLDFSIHKFEHITGYNPKEPIQTFDIVAYDIDIDTGDRVQVPNYKISDNIFSWNVSNTHGNEMYGFPARSHRHRYTGDYIGDNKMLVIGFEDGSNTLQAKKVDIVTGVSEPLEKDILTGNEDIFPTVKNRPVFIISYIGTEVPRAPKPESYLYTNDIKLPLINEGESDYPLLKVKTSNKGILSADLVDTSHKYAGKIRVATKNGILAWRDNLY